MFYCVVDTSKVFENYVEPCPGTPYPFSLRHDTGCRLAASVGNTDISVFVQL